MRWTTSFPLISVQCSQEALTFLDQQLHNVAVSLSCRMHTRRDVADVRRVTACLPLQEKSADRGVTVDGGQMQRGIEVVVFRVHIGASLHQHLETNER